MSNLEKYLYISYFGQCFTQPGKEVTHDLLEELPALSNCKYPKWEE